MGTCSSKPERPKYSYKNRNLEDYVINDEEEDDIDRQLKAIAKKIEIEEKKRSGKKKGKKSKRKRKKGNQFYTPGYFSEALISGKVDKKNFKIDDKTTDNHDFESQLQGAKSIAKNLKGFEIADVVFDAPPPDMKALKKAGDLMSADMRKKLMKSKKGKVRSGDLIVTLGEKGVGFGVGRDARD